jgi:7-carboxy-7-deazaguanine synthase
VRLAGCDLACTYCDTPAARDPSAGQVMDVPQIVAQIEKAPLPWVQVTGGEPLLQADGVNALAAALIGRGYEVILETSGAYPIETLHPRISKIVDLKTPGSGMADRMHWANVEHLSMSDEVKFVLTSREDYEWAKACVERHGLLERASVLFGAAAPKLDLALVAQWILMDRLPVRLNLQIHKWLGLP